MVSSAICKNLASFSTVEKLPNLEVFLLGRRITCMTIPSLVDAILTACSRELKLVVANYNVHSFNLSMIHPWFYKFLQNADIAHCDGVGILKAIQFMGLKLPLEYRASYTLLMPTLLERCNQEGISIFLLGAKPEHLQMALERMKLTYPNIRVSGHHGYLSMDDVQQNEAVIEQINREQPNILLVGMGMPRQENWVCKHRDRLNVNVIMVGGAVIDRLAGEVSDCPAWISNLGLEWLHRLAKEPRRLAVRYLVGNPAFLFQLLLAKAYASPLKVQTMSSIDF